MPLIICKSKFIEQIKLNYEQIEQLFDALNMATTLLIVKDLKVFGRSVIEGYLNGKTFEKISKENGVSKGTVFNIIKQWKDRVCVPDIDSLREFSVLVNKSGLTIEQCAQGFRFIKILSNFGITDELDIDYDPDPEDNSLVENSRLDTNAQIREEGNIGKKHANDTTTSRDSFHHFIARLYQDCKAHRIDSATMIRWIYDLLGFDFSDSKSVVNNPSVDDASNGYTPNLHKNVISKVTKNQIPFISKIDSYIEQKKIENQRLVDVRSLLSIDIESANEQKNTIDFNLKKAMEKEKNIINYYSWYKILKQQLQYNYGIALDEEFGSFAKAIDNFKNYNYDVLKLITDYKQVESLREEKEKIQNIIDLNIPLRDSLLNQIRILEENLSYSKQTMNTYEELLKRGLGLKELKQLLNTLMEISLANKLPVLDALPRFLKDIENQYDNKLGFESTDK